MPAKPETTFIRSVHKHLTGVYYMNNNNPYTAGVPDIWYSGNAASMWIEYKFLPRTPQRGVVVPDLSKLQARWLNGRYEEGRRVAVVVGHPSGGVVFLDREWDEGLPVAEFLFRSTSRPDLAEWIRQQVEVAADAPSSEGCCNCSRACLPSGVGDRPDSGPVIRGP